MADFNIQKVLEDVSYDQESFPDNSLTDFYILGEQPIVLNTNDQDDTKIIQLINSTKNPEDRNVFSRFIMDLKKTDEEYGRVVDQIRQALSAPGSFVLDILSKKNDVAYFSEIPNLNSVVGVIKFSSRKPVKIIDVGQIGRAHV